MFPGTVAAVPVVSVGTYATATTTERPIMTAVIGLKGRCVLRDFSRDHDAHGMSLGLATGVHGNALCHEVACSCGDRWLSDRVATRDGLTQDALGEVFGRVE